MTALIIICAVLALTFYMCVVIKIAFWISDIFDTIWYESGFWVYMFVGVTLLVSPVAILIDLAT